MPLTTLLGLAEDPGDIAGWGPVIADIARRIAADHPQGTWRYTIVDHTGRVLHHGNTRARPRAGVHQVNNRRRRPTAADAALVAARDRTCRAPGCRVPATSADLDHTRDWAYGGPTTPANLGVLCRHHHRLKHEGGWRLRQLFPGVFAWTSALGRSYLTGPEPHPP